MIKAVMVVPRVETKLYSEWVSLQIALTIVLEKKTFKYAILNKEGM